MSLLLNIIIISWNRPELLKGTVDSIIKQLDFGIIINKNNTKITIIDNGSNKETRDYIKSCGEEYILLEENKGISEAINIAMNHIKQSQYIMISDADMDYHLPFDDYILALQLYPQIGAITGHHSPERRVEGYLKLYERCIIALKRKVRGCHLILRYSDLKEFLPLPKEKKINFDVYIMQDAKNSIKNQSKFCGVIYGGAYHDGAKCSTWAKDEIDEIRWAQIQALMKEQPYLFEQMRENERRAIEKSKKMYHAPRK